MAILQNTQIYTDLPWETRFDQTGQKVGSGVQRQTTYVFRDGTGRRRKPEVLDRTPYIRRQYQSNPFQGVTKVTGKTPSRSYTSTGALPASSFFWNNCFSRNVNTVDSNLADLAYLRALSKLNHRDVDLGTAWLERAKTAQLLGDLGYKMAHFLDQLKKKKVREALNELGLYDDVVTGGGNVVDGYLAYRYAATPLMGEIAGLTRALARADPGAWMVRSSATERNDSSSQFDLTSNNTSVAARRSVKSGAYCSIIAKQRNISRADDLRWAFGLDNPLATFWEVTRYSFVLDWALPIGDWLSALNALKYYEGWGVSTSNKHSEVVYLHGISKVTPLDALYSGHETSGATTMQFTAFERKTFNTAYVPVLPVKDPASLKHMADGLSLLSAATSRAEDARLGRWLRL